MCSSDNHKGMQEVPSKKRYSVKLFDLDQRSKLIKLFFCERPFFASGSRTTISLIEPLFRVTISSPSSSVFFRESHQVIINIGILPSFCQK